MGEASPRSQEIDVTTETDFDFTFFSKLNNYSKCLSLPTLDSSYIILIFILRGLWCRRGIVKFVNEVSGLGFFGERMPLRPLRMPIPLRLFPHFASVSNVLELASS